MYKCHICNKEFDNHQKLGGHMIFHKNKGDYFKKEKKLNYISGHTINTYICLFCNKEFKKSGIGTHIRLTHKRKKDYKIWNKGLTKHTDIRVKIMGDSISKSQTGKVGKKHTEESKRKISEYKTLNNRGGKCKWFTYVKKNNDTFSVQGTWELKFCEVLDFLDKNWIKIGINNKEYSLKWFDKNKKEHLYTPDFYSPKENKFYEIKGYMRESDIYKMKQVFIKNPNINLEIVYKKELINYCNKFNIDCKKIK